MKKILQLIAIVTLLSAYNGYAFPSKQKLNVKHQVLIEQIKEQEKSVTYYQEHYKQNPTDANKAYLENAKQILRVLKHSGNTIYAEINATGTSKTLLTTAPLEEQRDSSGSLLVEKNAPVLNAILWLKSRQKWAEEEFQKNKKPHQAYLQ